MTRQDFFRSHLTTWAMSIALLFVMILAAKIMIQKYRVDKEISKLESQVEKVKQDNQKLGSLIQYFSTPDYQEKAAREKLNLKKDGEYVVGLPAPEETIAGATSVQAHKSYFKEWFNYFFSKPAGL